MRTRSFTLSLHWMITTAALLAGAGTAHAQYSTWRGNLYDGGPYADAFSNGLYWTTTNAPGATDVASFTGTGTQTLDGKAVNLVLDTSPTVLGFRSRYGSYTVNLDMAGYNLTTTTTTADYSQWEGASTGACTLVISNSAETNSVFHWKYFLIGRNSGIMGTVTVTGPRVTLSWDTLSMVGSAGVGVMNVLNGGTVSSTIGLTLGNAAAGDGTLLVSGNGSQALIGTASGNHLSVGSAGTGSVTVQDQGYLYIRDSLRFGVSAGASGTGLITGAGSSANVSVLAVTRGSLTIADNGHLAVRATGTASTVGDGSSFRLDNGTAAFVSHLTLNAGSTTQFVIKEERATPFITLGASGNLNIADGAALLAFELDANPDLGLGDFIPLISYGGSRNGLFSGFSEGQTFTLGLYDFEFTYGDAEKTLGLTVIPEPATMGLLLSAGALLALSTRRRRAGSR